MKASSDDAKSHGAAAPTAGSSAWAPFRSPDFARMASAQFVSNIGSWMQTVGAQELMLTLTTSATLVALIQTAAGLPVVLLSVPAGAIGDLVDRRRLLIASQSFMLIAALLLAGLAFAGLVTPLVLLALIFAVGIGQTLTSPVWQTLQPELVAPQDRTQAISLGAVNMNLSRAIGPALGGALYAASSAAVLFLVNALSFVPVIGAVARWRGRPRPASAVAREHVVEAIRAGARYIAGSPALRVILLRAGLFMFFGNSLWALLPIVANTRLHLGSGGYGLLLGGVGIGAVAGAAIECLWSGRFGPMPLVGASSSRTAFPSRPAAMVHFWTQMARGRTPGTKNRNYPAVPLDRALTVARAIEHQASGMKTSRLTLADLLGTTPTSRVFRELIGSSRLYGLTVGGINADEFDLTDLGNSGFERRPGGERSGLEASRAECAALQDVLRGVQEQEGPHAQADDRLPHPRREYRQLTG